MDPGVTDTVTVFCCPTTTPTGGALPRAVVKTMVEVPEALSVSFWTVRTSLPIFTWSPETMPFTEPSSAPSEGTTMTVVVLPRAVTVAPRATVAEIGVAAPLLPLFVCAVTADPRS
jgi:hypothetical protein